MLSRRTLQGPTAGDPLAGDGVREPGVSHLVFMSIENAEVAAKLGEVVSDAAARVADLGTEVAACQRILPGVVARHRDVPESRAD